MTTPRGAFVVFEGGDGAGKTTQVERLCSQLQTIGYEVVRTFEPGGTALGGVIRDLVLDHGSAELAVRAEALLYAADKAQHVREVIVPALRRGALVVSDRYVDSMLAYQGAGRVLAVDDLERLARWATEDVRPDLTVVLDVEPELAVEEKTNKDRLEGAGRDFHLRARQHFLALAAREPARYLVLDARKSREEIGDQVADRVRRILSEAPGRLVP